MIQLWHKGESWKIFPNFEITIADEGIYIYLVWLKLSIGLFIKIVS